MRDQRNGSELTPEELVARVEAGLCPVDGKPAMAYGKVCQDCSDHWHSKAARPMRRAGYRQHSYYR
jgi:hypothetical protein